MPQQTYRVALVSTIQVTTEIEVTAPAGDLRKAEQHAMRRIHEEPPRWDTGHGGTWKGPVDTTMVVAVAEGPVLPRRRPAVRTERKAPGGERRLRI